MVRTIVKCLILLLGIVAAAPLSAQQPDRPQAPREWSARPGRDMARSGPRRRNLRRHRRRMMQRHPAFQRLDHRRFNRMPAMRMRMWRGTRGI